MIRRRIGLLVTLLMIAGAACAGGEQGGSEPIKIGASLPLTGPFSVSGEGHRQGYELCIDLVNERGGWLGRKVELAIEDNRSDTQTVTNQYERFITAQDVDLLFATYSTYLSFPASAIAEQNKMVWLEPSDSSLRSHMRGFKYSFGLTLKPIDLIGQTPVDALFDYREKGVIPASEFPETAAVVYLDDFFSNSISRGLLGGTIEVPGRGKVDFPSYLGKKGIELVYSQQYPKGFRNWVSLANDIKASGADLLFALTLPPDHVELVKAFQTVGYQPDVAFFSQGTQPEFKESLGDAVNGIMVWSTWSPAIEWKGVLAGEPFTNQDFVEAYQQKYPDKQVSEDVVQAFVACQIMDQAVRATGTVDNTKLRDWLASRTAQNPARTIQGDYYWDDRGLTSGRDVLLLQWQKGELEFVYPFGKEYTGRVDLVYPKPEW